MLQDAAGAVSARVTPKVDEPALIRAVQRGDADAFEQLVRAYDQSVLRLALNLLRSRSINVLGMISDSFPLFQARRAFRRAAERGNLKVLLNAG